MSPIEPPISASAEADLERRLRALPPVPGPDPRFRAELRVQLLAAVERGPLTDSTSAGEWSPAGGRRTATRPGRSTATRSGPAHGATGDRRFPFPGALRPHLPSFPSTHLGRRTVAVLGAALAVVLVFTATTYWLAQRALPGDALYGLKRAGETVDLSTKQGDVSRGGAYLSLSTTRIDEAEALVKRATSAAEPGTAHRHPGLSAAGPLSPHVDELVRDVLSDGDTSAVTATRLLTTASVANRAQKPVTSVTTWLSDQRSKVGVLVLRLPETAPTTAGGAARTLARDLAAIEIRVRAITAGVRCATCRFATSDRLGPLPCRTCPSPVSAPSPPGEDDPSARAGTDGRHDRAPVPHRGRPTHLRRRHRVGPGHPQRPGRLGTDDTAVTRAARFARLVHADHAAHGAGRADPDRADHSAERQPHRGTADGADARSELSTRRVRQLARRRHPVTGPPCHRGADPEAIGRARRSVRTRGWCAVQQPVERGLDRLADPVGELERQQRVVGGVGAVARGVDRRAELDVPLARQRHQPQRAEPRERRRDREVRQARAPGPATWRCRASGGSPRRRRSTPG